MGNILKKIIQQKKAKERAIYELKLHRENCWLPDYMQADEYKIMMYEREKKDMLLIKDFLQELLDKPQRDIDAPLSKQQDNGI
jgi:hypothetical protein